MDIFPDGKVYVGDSSNGIKARCLVDSYDHRNGPSEPADGQFVDTLRG
jgi:hypothetical protein